MNEVTDIDEGRFSARVFSLVFGIVTELVSLRGHVRHHEERITCCIV